MTKIKCSSESDGGIILHERKSALKAPHPHSPSALNSKSKKDLFVQSNDKTHVEKSRIGPDESCSGDHNLMKKEHIFSDIRKLNRDKGMVGDNVSDSESKEHVSFNFEHEELSYSEISSKESQRTHSPKRGTFEIVKPIRFDEDEKKYSSIRSEDENIYLSGENKNIFNQFSEICAPDEISKNADLVGNEDREKTEEFPKHVNETMEHKQNTTDTNQQKAKTISSVKGIFSKAFEWALDEFLYSGVRNNDSFINKLSQTLTG